MSNQMVPGQGRSRPKIDAKADIKFRMEDSDDIILIGNQSLSIAEAVLARKKITPIGWEQSRLP